MKVELTHDVIIKRMCLLAIFLSIGIFIVGIPFHYSISGNWHKVLTATLSTTLTVLVGMSALILFYVFIYRNRDEKTEGERCEKCEKIIPDGEEHWDLITIGVYKGLIDGKRPRACESCYRKYYEERPR